MADVVLSKASLARRYRCDLDGYCYRTPWDDWGRWVAFTIVVLTFFILAYLFSVSRQSNRRRRDRGLVPMYGTGWVSHAKSNNTTFQQPNTVLHHMYHNLPAPPYSPPYVPPAARRQSFEATSGNKRAHQGYNGGIQNSEIELQQPKVSYQPPGVSETNYESLTSLPRKS